MYGGEYPFFQTGDVKSADLYLTDYSQTYSEKGLRQSKLWNAGTLCITIAANIAETAILGVPGCFPDSIVGFVPDPQKADVYFVKYYLDTLKIRMQNVSRGTTQDNLSLDKLLAFRLVVPAVHRQRQVSDVLRTYDDLIANNLRQTRVLDEMVRVLFRDWCPQKSPLKSDGLPASVPSGWHQASLGELVDEIRRNVPKGDLGAKANYVGLEHIPRRSLALDDWVEVAELGSNKLAFMTGEVLFGKIRPYFHKVSVAPFDGVCSADTIVLGPKKAEDYGLVVAVVSSDTFVQHATATSNGAKMPRASWSVLREYPVLVPSLGVRRRFSEFVRNVVALQRNLVLQNRNLRQTRDLLLPRLLSGQIELPHAEEALAGTASATD